MEIGDDEKQYHDPFPYEETTAKQRSNTACIHVLGVKVRAPRNRASAARQLIGSPTCRPSTYAEMHVLERITRCGH